MKAGNLRVGIAEKEIQVKEGLMMGDAAPFATGSRTPLYIKALVLDNGDTRIALVTLDLMGLFLFDTNRIREAAEKRCNIPKGNIMVVASHSHVSPSSIPAMHTYARAFNPLCDDSAMEREQMFLDQLVEDAADAICTAAEAVSEASIGYISLNIPWVSFNRRRLTKNYGAWTHWMGVPQDQAYGVEGPIDPELGLFVIRGADYGTRALLWCFAAHNSFHFDDKFSADIAYTVQEAVNQRIGSHIPCLYMPGCCGNLNYYDFNQYDQDPHPGLEKATDAIASAIIASYRNACTLPKVELAVLSSELEFAQRDVTRSWWEDDIRKKLPAWIETGYIQKELEERRKEEKITYTSEVMVIRIGNIALVGLPGEVFVEFGLDIKARSPFKNTCVAAYSNDYAGYVATRQAFINGSYEAWPVLNARIGKEGGYLMADKVVDLLNEIYED